MNLSFLFIVLAQNAGIYLVDAKVVLPHASTNDLRTPLKRRLKWPPPNASYPDKNSEWHLFLFKNEITTSGHSISNSSTYSTAMRLED